MTEKEFIETAPLYRRVEINNFSPPTSITRMCSRCAKETTWARGGDPMSAIMPTKPQIVIYSIGYTCVLCAKNSMAVIYELLDWREDPKSSLYPKSWHHLGVRKIGQVPPQDISISGELESRLGVSAAYYKKALVCRAQNYGVGAMAYMRRVVDEKTDELISVMAKLAQTYNVNEAEVTTLLAAKNEVRFEDKMKVAIELVPVAIRPGGANPLAQLYHYTSMGLHGKSDDECGEIFDDLRSDFEYVFRNLHLQAEERRQFAERVKARAGGNLAQRGSRSSGQREES